MDREILLAMKFHSALILLLTAKLVAPERLERSGGSYTCNNQGLVEFRNCTNNSKIQISKDTRNYKLRLCSNDQCMPVAATDMSLDWIRCRDICDACRALLGPNSENIKFVILGNIGSLMIAVGILLH